MAKDKAKNKKAANAPEAKAGKPASRAAAKVAEKLEAGADLYSGYKDKAPSALQARFAGWLIDKLGLTFGSKKEEAAFRDGVRLAVALRIPFQASPENQAANAAAKSEPKEKKAAKSKVDKAAAAGAALDEATEEAVAEAEPAEAEAAPAKKAPAKKAPAKKVAAAAEPATEAVTEKTTAAKKAPPKKVATGSKAPF